MKYVMVFEFTQERLSELAEQLECGEAHVIDGMLNLLEVEASSERKSCAEILADYM